jgi:hypothetical protein
MKTLLFRRAPRELADGIVFGKGTLLSVATMMQHPAVSPAAPL